jgi:lipopolysaccharide export system protein LptA
MSLTAILIAAAAVAAAETPTTNANTSAACERPPEARITSDSTYYDRKEGLVVFKGRVHVDDAEYQMHSERGYLFLSETNSLRRIVAVGGVSLTNGLRRAYADKVIYRRDNGLVILHGKEGAPATVVEDTVAGERSVRGRKIRFWVNQEQVEVIEADISAPKASGGPGALKDLVR